MAIADVAILLAVVVSMAYFRVQTKLWTGCVFIVLLLLTLFGQLGFIALTFCWLFYIAAAAFANLATYRLRYFSRPLIHKLHAHMPAISPTEREAIEAGDVWWEKDLFCGRPQWKKLLAMPAPQLSAEEDDFINNQVETLCGMLNDWEITQRDHDLPTAVWDYIKKERFFGMVIPKSYGGLGFSTIAHSTVVMKIATRSVSAAVDVMVPNSLGPAELLLHYGTTEQKAFYLPRLATGQEIPCFALTGPEAGSDAGSMTDSGIVCYGKYKDAEVLGIRLTWDKRYITLAPIATVLGLAFRLYDPDQLLGSTVDRGITLCLVPTSHPGVEIGDRHLPLHMAFMNGPTRGKDVFIPLDWIIGGPEMAGQGWRMLMECLSIGRSVSLPALSTASGKLCYRMTGAYARVRKQFNTAIANFEGIEEALGDIAGLTYLLEACRKMTAGAVDQHIRPSIVSAIAKYHMTEMARKIIHHAMDIHAGHGIQMGPRNILASGYLATPVSITVEGANILTRNLIIFGQGAIRCHPYALQEIELFATPESAQRDVALDRLLLSHIGYGISNAVRSFWLGLTGARLVFSPVRGKTARYYRQLTRMSSVLALLADISMMLLGGNLKRKERISARLGDMLSELYLASTVLKYFQDQGQPESDVIYVRWCVESCLYRMQKSCYALLQNFPQKIVGKILSFLIFPFGTAYQKPSDQLHQQVVQPMLVPSALRDRLTQYCYLGRDESDSIVKLEAAFIQQAQLEPVLKKFQQAIRNGTVPRHAHYKERLRAAVVAGILTEEEFQALLHLDALQKEVIQVNEFSFDFSTVIA